MGRAIVRKPAVFLFDEPLSNLDAKMRVEMRKEILQLHRRIAATMIYVTHDQIEAMTLGDRICVMNAGVIEQVGPPTLIFDHPASLFVARFIGTPPMNIFEGQLRCGTEGELIFDGDTIQCPLPADKASMLEGWNGKKVCLGIRPRALKLAGGNVPNAFEGIIDIFVFANLRGRWKVFAGDAFSSVWLLVVRLCAEVRVFAEASDQNGFRGEFFQHLAIGVAAIDRRM